MDAIRADERVLAVVQDQGGEQGGAASWPELKLIVYIEQDAKAAFVQGLPRLPMLSGAVLLAYARPDGSYRAVLGIGESPLCVDFAIKTLQEPPLPSWGNLQILQDGTSGALERAGSTGRAVPGQTDPRFRFYRQSAEFWTGILGTQRLNAARRFWKARLHFFAAVLPNLMGLLEIEGRQTEGATTGDPAADVETVVSSKRLAQFDNCIPAASGHGVGEALFAAAELGRSVCFAVSSARGWEWPEALAEKFNGLLRSGDTPDRNPVQMRPIGIVENSIDALVSPDAIKAVTSRIRVYPEYSEGLEGLEGGQRLLVVFQFHRLAGCDLLQHPRNDSSRPKRGVFALHSPRRPNPIGVTEVRLMRRDGNILEVKGLDAVNGTPVLDLKLNS